MGRFRPASCSASSASQRTMRLVIRTLRLVAAYLCGTLATAGMLAFALPISISAGRVYLLPITILLLPVILVGAAMMCLFGPIAQVLGISAHYEDSLHGEADEAGITIRNHEGRQQRLIEWNAIEELLTVFRPPILEYELRLRDGEVIELATLPTEGLQSTLALHGIEWTGGRTGMPH